MLSAATPTPMTTPTSVSPTRVKAATGASCAPSPVMIRAIGVTTTVVRM